MQGWICSKFWQCRVSSWTEANKENRRDAVFFVSPRLLSLSLCLYIGIQISIQSLYIYIILYTPIYTYRYTAYSMLIHQENRFWLQCSARLSCRLLFLKMQWNLAICFFSSCHAPIFSRFRFWKANLPWIDPNKNPSWYELRVVIFFFGSWIFEVRKSLFHLYLFIAWYVCIYIYIYRMI